MYIIKKSYPLISSLIQKVSGRHSISAVTDMTASMPWKKLSSTKEQT